MLIITHNACTDGHCAAYIFSKKFPEAQIYYANYKEKPPSAILNEDVLLVDYCYKKGDGYLDELLEKCKTVTILDHHSSVKQDLENIKNHPKVKEIRFNLNKSGARLAWEYCFGDNKSHWIVDYVEDYDLWKFELPFSMQINTAINSYDRSFETWDYLVTFMDLDWFLKFSEQPSYSVKLNYLRSRSLEKLKIEGEALIRQKETLTSELLKNTIKLNILGFEVPAVNTYIYRGDIATLLSQTNVFGVTFFQRADRLWQFSIRSKEGGLNVGELCKKLGGGGHDNAGGFELKEIPACGIIK